MSANEMQANILIVDDRPDKLLALEAVLAGLGENVICATSGRDALRHVLNTEFAVILLDVNMPGMDGFETASLIRQRRNSQHVPIIFITAYGDEMHVVRGYSLGAVDYILTPVVPEVLSSKVAIFVDLFRKSQKIQLQAQSLGQRAGQLQKLAHASIVINSALSLDNMLQTVTNAAIDVLSSHQAILLFVDPRPGRRHGKTQAFSAFSDRYKEWRGRPLHLDNLTHSTVLRNHTATRLSEAEVQLHPDWEIVKNLQVPPIRGGMLAAPLTGRDGTRLGVIYVADPVGAAFTADDEVVAVQLAQMASIAIENALFAEEREANRLKEEFLSTLSHELRTPLNAILGWTQILRMQKVQGEIGHGIEVIERNAKAQARLIEDLLDVSRISTEKFRLTRQQLSLETLVRDACESHRPAATAKGVELVVSVADASTELDADPDRMRQVLANLLSNATKFTASGGTITVASDRFGDVARIRVSDSGCGIDAAFLPWVFDRFRQADSSSTRRQGGLGIGLAIVRHIVELHGGSVRAESKGLGHGALFTVLLPLASRQREVNGKHRETLENGASPHVSLEGSRILLLDDQADATDMLKRILCDADANVSTANSAAEALEQVPLFRPDVIISDIAMPVQDGYAFIRQLRLLPEDRGGRTPAIALTAYARDEDRATAAAEGFQVHISKPVDPATVIREVRRLRALGRES